MRALLLLVALCACGDNIKAQDGGIGSDATIDAPPSATGHCIDRPTGLQAVLAPPSGALPCEMLPPGFPTEAP